MMNDPQDLKRAARIFKSLSHPGRLEIACLIGSGRFVTQRDLIEKLDGRSPRWRATWARSAPGGW